MSWTSIITALVRLLVAWLMGALASHLSAPVWTLVNDIIIKIGGTEALVLSIVGILLTGGAAIWVRLKTKYHLQIALNLPKGSTIQDVKDASTTLSITPPTNTPKP